MIDRTVLKSAATDRTLLERAAAELGNVSQAVIDFTQKLCALDPSDRVKVLLALAIDCAKAGDFQKAEGWFRLARELEPQFFATADETV